LLVVLLAAFMDLMDVTAQAGTGSGLFNTVSQTRRQPRRRHPSPS
jgi:hypothetical protein